MTLDGLPFRTPALVVAIQWESLTPAEGRRLRNLGLDEGVRIETLHCGPVGRDPIAIRLGRMTVAMRRSHARAVSVEQAAAA